jgi:glycosyltransferase involved in cell wall biosynthesis
VRILLSIHHALDEDQGAPGITLALGRAYEDLGHTVSYLSFGDLPRKLPGLGKELLFPEFAAWHLTRRSRENLDVVDASTGDAWLWARTWRRGQRRPLLVTRSHGLEHRYWKETVGEAKESGAALRRRSRLYHGGFRLREVAASLRLADLCVFSNHDDLELAVARLGVARARATVRLNGLPAAFLGRSLPRAASRELRIAHIGSYAERKGARYVAGALAQILGRRDGVRASFLGARVSPGRVLADLPATVRARVEVVPEYRRAELPSLIEGHHVLVSASLAEGFSLALPEAMACGLAPVATSIPGSREIIRDGENGLLVPPGDAMALAQALDRVLSDRDRLDALRARAHDSVQRLSWERIAAETVELYEAGLRRLGRSASTMRTP